MTGECSETNRTANNAKSRHELRHREENDDVETVARCLYATERCRHRYVMVRKRNEGRGRERKRKKWCERVLSAEHRNAGET